MKIAISAQGDNLSAQIDPRFGRTKYFILVDPDTMKFEAIVNDAMNSVHGAGTQAGQLMSANNVTTLITGHVGPNAYITLQAANIKIYHGDNQTVAQAIEQFKANQLPEVTEAGPAHGGMTA
jgi:predicted Fe-Mo cluster-binding NifX family protein